MFFWVVKWGTIKVVIFLGMPGFAVIAAGGKCRYKKSCYYKKGCDQFIFLFQNFSGAYLKPAVRYRALMLLLSGYCLRGGVLLQSACV